MSLSVGVGELDSVNKVESLNKVESVNMNVDNSHAKSTMTNDEVAKVIESTLGPIQTLAKPAVKGRRKKAAK